MGRATTRRLLIVLLAGLVWRLALIWVIEPGRGFVGDLTDFQNWATTLDHHGPSRFYQYANEPNYPPLYMYVLWGLGTITRPLSYLTSMGRGELLLALIRLPAILADVGVGALVFRFVRPLRGDRAAVWAAALYLACPVTWYDSALWGQVDAVVTLLTLGATIAVLEDHYVLAFVLTALAVLTKPQAIIVVFIVVPVVVGHYLRAPSVARRSSRETLARATLAALAAALAVCWPFDLSVVTNGTYPSIPFFTSADGLLHLITSDVGQYNVLTANAFNPWSTVGPVPLWHGLGHGTAVWVPDQVHVLFGWSAFRIGTALFLLTVALVVVGLLRDGRPTTVMLGYTVLCVAFAVAPTRVHERYIFPAFAGGAALVATAGPLILYAISALAVTVNLNAVLAGPLPSVTRSLSRDGYLGPAPATPTSPIIGLARQIYLPLAGVCRSELAIISVASWEAMGLLGLTLTFAKASLSKRSAGGDENDAPDALLVAESV